MTRALLEQLIDAMHEDNVIYPSDALIEALRAELAKPAQQERKPHTEAEVQVLLNMCDPHYSRKAQEKVIRRILKVPA